jgi:hypothetical protein
MLHLLESASLKFGLDQTIVPRSGPNFFFANQAKVGRSKFWNHPCNFGLDQKSASGITDQVARTSAAVRPRALAFPTGCAKLGELPISQRQAEMSTSRVGIYAACNELTMPLRDWMNFSNSGAQTTPL